MFSHPSLRRRNRSYSAPALLESTPPQEEHIPDFLDHLGQRLFDSTLGVESRRLMNGIENRLRDHDLGRILLPLFKLDHLYFALFLLLLGSTLAKSDNVPEITIRPNI